MVMVMAIRVGVKVGVDGWMGRYTTMLSVPLAVSSPNFAYKPNYISFPTAL